MNEKPSIRRLRNFNRRTYDKIRKNETQIKKLKNQIIQLSNENLEYRKTIANNTIKITDLEESECILSSKESMRDRTSRLERLTKRERRS